MLQTGVNDSELVREGNAGIRDHGRKQYGMCSPAESAPDPKNAEAEGFGRNCYSAEVVTVDRQAG